MSIRSKQLISSYKYRGDVVETHVFFEMTCDSSLATLQDMESTENGKQKNKRRVRLILTAR